MRYLQFISLLLVFGLGCRSVYKSLPKTSADKNCIAAAKPVFTNDLYQAHINVVGRELSGLLLCKTMPDSSLRVVFSSETGFTFFNFSFFGDSGFAIHQVIKQFNRKPIITTLRKDFGILIQQNIAHATSFDLIRDAEILHGFKQEKGVNYYVTDSNCTYLYAERGSSRKPVMRAWMFGRPHAAPDSISITHLNFQFAIALKKIDRHVTE